MSFAAFSSCFPNSILKYLWVTFAKDDLKNINIVANPPTILYIPKSKMPKLSKTTREVYKDMNIRNSILM